MAACMCCSGRMPTAVRGTRARFGKLRATVFFHVLEFLYANGCPWDERACAHAAWAGHQDVLQWLVDRGCPFDDSVCTSAGISRHLDIMEWGHQHGLKFTPEGFGTVAGCGHRDVMQWALDHGTELTADVMYHSRTSASIPTLEWLRAQGCPWDRERCLQRALIHSRHKKGPDSVPDWIRAQAD